MNYFAIPAMQRPDTRLIFDGREFRTPRTLMDMGIGLCHQCGNTLRNFRESLYCKTCREETLVLAPDAPPPHTPPQPEVKLELPPLKINPEWLCKCGEVRRKGPCKQCKALETT